MVASEYYLNRRIFLLNTGAAAILPFVVGSKVLAHNVA